MEDPEFTDFWQLLELPGRHHPGDPAGGTGRRGVLAL